MEINSINKSINTCYTSIHSTPFPFLPLTKNSRTAPPSSPMLTSRNATQRKEFVDSSMSKQVRREDLLTRLCKGTRSRIETKLLPRRIFGEGTTSRFEIDSISRLKRWRYFDDRISHLVTRSSRAKREFDIYRNRFRDLKLIVQVMATRVINYQSIIHRVLTVNYDPKEWARNVWCLRKLELDTELYFSNTIIPLPFSPLFSKHRTCHITRIRKQEFDSLFCFGNPRIYSTHF